MSSELFADPVELTPELIEQHVHNARRRRSEAAGGLWRVAAQWLRRWFHRPAQGHLAASAR